MAGETYKCVIIKYSHSGSEVYFLKFQFFERDKSSVLNLKCVGIAKQVHQDIIVKIRYHSRAGIVHSVEYLSCHICKAVALAMLDLSATNACTRQTSSEVQNRVQNSGSTNGTDVLQNCYKKFQLINVSSNHHANVGAC